MVSTLMRVSALLLLCGVLCFSCKKPGNNEVPPDPDSVLPVTEAKYSSKDPGAFSAATSVWHGQRVAGLMPALSTSASLKLAVPPENIVAIKGQPVILKPVINEGDVAGYYVSINGASEYFKVDFTKARNLAKARNSQNNSISNTSVHSFGKPSIKERKHLGISLMGGDDNFNDSTIVIKLPNDIKTPDTICVTYWAYDYSNQISKPMTTCIYVSHLGNDSDNNWMTGTWRETSYEELVDNKIKTKDTIIFNQWILVDKESFTKLWNHNDSLCVQFFENGIALNHDSIYGYYDTPDGRPSAYFIHLSGRDKFLGYGGWFESYEKEDITFDKNGSYTYEEVSTQKEIIFDSSTVNNLVYRFEDYNFSDRGSWSFNSPTNKMTVISINNEKDYDNYIDELTVIKVSDNIMILEFSELGENNEVHTHRSRCERQ